MNVVTCVACSKAGSAKGLHILALTEKKETNEVYKEVLCWIFIIRMYNTCILKNN
jgi:hypothetical protein